MAFDLHEHGSHAAIRYDGEEILKLDQHVLFFGDKFVVRDQCMQPGAGPEVSSMPLFASYGYGKAMELDDGSLFISYISTGGHRADDARANAIWCIRLRVRSDHSGIDLLPAPNRTVPPGETDDLTGK